MLGFDAISDLAISDIPSGSVSMSVSDALAFGQSVLTNKDIWRDTLTFSETVKRIIPRTLSDYFYIHDALTPTRIHNLKDRLAFLEGKKSTDHLKNTVSEILTFLDSVSQHKVINLAVGDALAFAQGDGDSVPNHPRVRETITLTDSVSATIRHLLKVINESLDFLERCGVLPVHLGNTIHFNETIHYSPNHQRGIVDQLILNELLSYTIRSLRPKVTERISFVETVLNHRKLGSTLETLLLTETVRQNLKHQTASDTIKLRERFVLGGTKKFKLKDKLTLTDTVVIHGTRKVSACSCLSFAESLNRIKQQIVSDHITLIEKGEVPLMHVINLVEAVTTNAVKSCCRGWYLPDHSAFDILSLGESVSLGDTVRNPTFSEVIRFYEAPSWYPGSSSYVLPSIGRALAESIVFSDTATEQI